MSSKNIHISSIKIWGSVRLLNLFSPKHRITVRDFPFWEKENLKEIAASSLTPKFFVIMKF